MRSFHDSFIFLRIFPFVGNTTYLLQVYACDADSCDEIVALVVGGGAAVVASYNEMDKLDIHDINNTDSNDNDSVQSLRGIDMVVPCFEA